MAFQPIYEKVVASSKVKGGLVQSVVDIKLSPAEDGNVSKVLCASAHVFLASSNLENTDVVYGGVVNAQVLYSASDGAIRAQNYSAVFEDRYSFADDYAGATPIVSMQVVDTKYNLVGNEIRVSVIIESNIDLIVTTTTNALTGFAEGDVFTKKELLKYNTYAGLSLERADNTFDIDIRDGVSQVLSVSTDAFIKKVTPYNNYAKVDGGINILVTYLSSDEVPALRTYSTCQDVSFESTLEGLNTNSSVVSDIMVAHDDVKFTTTLDTNSAKISATVPTVYRGYVFNEQELEVVTDLFSTTNLISTSTQSFVTAQNILNACTTDKLDGSVSIDESSPFIDDIIGVSAYELVVSGTRIDDTDIIVEGVANVCTLYLNKETESINSVIVPLPFSTAVNGSFAENTSVEYVVSLGSLSARSRRGKEIDVNAILNVYVNAIDQSDQAVISEVTQDDEIPESECALSIVVANGTDTIWDIAKREFVDPDKLLEQNPNLELPLSAGDRVVIYRQRLAEF